MTSCASQLYKSILVGKIEYPRHFKTAAKDLVANIVTQDLSVRLGNLKVVFTLCLRTQCCIMQHTMCPVQPKQSHCCGLPNLRVNQRYHGAHQAMSSRLFFW